ncbi:MAG: ankyrin repeat domain-containing protein [Simkaniaceae bacterium]|nr:ankyrin repeat domain-containing protein [Candidatus Sacchlamyda saccharinae]
MTIKFDYINIINMKIHNIFTINTFPEWEKNTHFFPQLHRLVETLRNFHLDLEDENGKTFLHRSAAAGDIAQTYATVILGGDTEAKDDSGETPLHKAIRHGAIANVQALIAAGAKPNTPNANGKTPLDLALNAKQNRSEMIRVLLEAGGDPDIVLEKFEPLIRATMSENEREIYGEIIEHAQVAKRRQRVRVLAFVNHDLNHPICQDVLKIVANHTL